MTELPVEPEDELLRPARGVDQERAAPAPPVLLTAVGADPARPAPLDPPARRARAHSATFAALWPAPHHILPTPFEGDHA